MAIVELVQITKRFAAFTALDHVSLSIDAGEIHCLVGENGAGKSTLIRLLSGVLSPDAGQIRVAGQAIHLPNPVAARRHGIVTVHQETELFAPLSVAENLALSAGLPTLLPGLVDWRSVTSVAQLTARSLHQQLDTSQPAGRLPIAQRQMIHIAAAMSHRARILLLDEPTAALSEAECRWLFDHIRAVRESGLAIIYISHRLSEIFALADRITVLRDGRNIWTGPKDSITPEEMVRAMVGREYQSPLKRRPGHAAGPRSVRLEVDGLEDRAGRFSMTRLEVRGGEIVGMYGLVGSGRSELAQAIVGLRTVAAGSVRVNGNRLKTGDPGGPTRCGLALVPEDRLRESIFPELSIRTNSAIAALDRWRRGPLTSPARERGAVGRQVRAFGIRCRSIEQPVLELSGGNQQKVVLSRWMLTEPGVLILDEPTRGIDVAAKADIHTWLRDWADRGNGVLMISSDLPEVLEHCDRILVFREGRIAGQFDPATSSAEQIAAAALPDQDSRRLVVAKAHRLGGRSRDVAAEMGLLVAILALGALLSATTSGFLTATNLLSLFTNTAVWSILALAAAGVIIAGVIDISIGAILALSAASCALIMKSSLPTAWSIPLGMVGGIGVGALAGATNAVIVLAGRVHPIIVTLATMTAFRGLLIMLTGGDALTELPSRFDRLATARLLGVNGSIVTMIVVVTGMHFWLSRTVWGRQSYALGASPASAWLVGISKTKVWLIAFSLGGALAAVAGLLELAQSGSMQSSLGTGYELRAIAAAVIGGAAITGGRGSALGVFSGALLISLVHNALVLWQVSRYHNDLVIGGLILAAVLWDLLWQKLDLG